MPTVTPSSELTRLLSSDDNESAKEIASLCVDLYELNVPPLPTEPQNDKSEIANKFIEKRLNERGAKSLKNILAAGVPFEQFSADVAHYDRSSRCGRVWESNAVAYRCRTCAKNNCMSLCSECFRQGNHDGHDYNRFWSMSGGACDCGNESVMEEEGFCPRHRNNNQILIAPAPMHLSAPAFYTLPQLLFHLIHNLRYHFYSFFDGRSEKEIVGSIDELLKRNDIETDIDVLRECAELSGPVRQQLVKILIDPDIYERLNNLSTLKLNGINARSNVLESLPTIAKISNLSEQQIAKLSDGCSLLTASPKYECILDECVLWMVRLHYPQPFVLLMLSMIAHCEYKIALSEAFFAHYSRTMAAVAGQPDNEMSRHDGDSLCSRIVHISVQILSGSADVLSLMNESQTPLPRLLISCLRCIINPCIVLYSNRTKNDCICVPASHVLRHGDRPIVEHRQYWAIVTDFHNILSHHDVALNVLYDWKYAIANYIDIVSLVQGMAEVERRIRGDHIMYEQHYYYAYSTEIELCSMCMWPLVIAAYECENAKEITLQMAQRFCDAIGRWFDGFGFRIEEMSRVKFSFHIPLHRHLASFLTSLLALRQPFTIDYRSECKCGAVTTIDNNTQRQQLFIRKLVMHPLTILASRAEIACGMWVRNGQSLAYQSVLHSQGSHCSAFIDLDVSLLQILATSIDNIDWFIYTIIDRFRMTDIFLSASGVEPQQETPEMRNEWTAPMMEAMMRCLALIVHYRAAYPRSQEDELKLMRVELMTSLCLSSDGQKHSRLRESLPSRGRDSQSDAYIEELLPKMADVHDAEGGAVYRARANSWLHDFDPLHVSVRAHRTNVPVHATLRYAAIVKSYATAGEQSAEQMAALSTIPTSIDDALIWPPWRVNEQPIVKGVTRLLRSRTMHALIHVNIAKAVAAFDEELPIISYQSISLCVHILTAALYERQLHRIAAPGRLDQEAGPIGYLNKYFDTDDIVINACQISAWKQAAFESKYPFNLAPLFGKSLLENLMILFARFAAKRSTTSLKHRAFFPDKALYYAEIPQITPDAAYYIGRLLQRFYDESIDCRRLIEDINGTSDRQAMQTDTDIDGINNADDNNDVILDPKERLRMAARRRQEIIMARMRQKQARAMNAIIASEVDRLRLDSGLTPQEAADAESVVNAALSNNKDDTMEQDSALVCCICTRPAVSTLDEPMALLVALHQTDVLAHCQPTGVENYDVELEARRTDERVQQRLTMSYGATSSKQALPSIEYTPRITRKLIENTVSAALRAEVGDDPLSELTLALTQPKSDSTGSMRARTCGHVTHVACHVRFMIAAQSDSNRFAGLEESLMPRIGEFYCPMCRRRCNAILPLSPADTLGAQIDVAVPIHSSGQVEFESGLLSIEQAVVATERALNRALHGPLEVRDSAYSRACANYLEQCRQAAKYGHSIDYTIGAQASTFELQLHEHSLSPNLIRTNIELELMLYDQGSLRQNDLKRSVVGASLPVLSARYVRLAETRRLTSRDCEHEWPLMSSLELAIAATGDELLAGKHSTVHLSSALPLLLRDPISLFNRFMLVLLYGHNLDDDNHRRQAHIYLLCIYSCLLRLQLVRACLNLLLSVDDEQRNMWLGHREHFSAFLDAEVLTFFNQVCMRAKAIGLFNSRLTAASKKIMADCEFTNLLPIKLTTDRSDQFICSFIHSSILPFARYVCLFAHHTRLASFADLSVLDSFHNAHRHLLRESPLMQRGTTELLPWSRDTVDETLDLQLNLLAAHLAGHANSMQALLFTNYAFSYASARLVKLPESFDVLFELYNNRACEKCGRAPKQCLICLQCGQMICFNDPCCNVKTSERLLSEAETHVSKQCSAGQAILLNVQTSMILVAKGLRGSLWGSVYLDEHGEEDAGLRRGKPMKLSKKRYTRLEKEWQHQELTPRDAYDSGRPWQLMAQNYLLDLGNRNFYL